MSEPTDRESAADPQLLQRAVSRRVPFLDLLDIKPIEAALGRAVFELNVDERHLRTHGLLHGGVTATLLDTAMGYAAFSMAPPGHYVLTVQLNLNYTRPILDGERILTTGEVLHAGRKTCVARSEVRSESGELAAVGSATFMFVPE